MLKTLRGFGESKPDNDEDPEISIIDKEDLQVKLDVIGYRMTDDQVMIQALNSQTTDYVLPMLMLEKSIGIQGNSLSMEGLKEELNLRFERHLSKKYDKSGKEKVLISKQLKGKCRHCRKMGHEAVHF